MLKYLKKINTILGINERNIKYIKTPLTEIGKNIPDNKLKTKEILRNAGIPVPKTYKIIKNEKELESCNWNKLPNSFVVKPNLGIAGKGILIVFGKKLKKEEESKGESKNEKNWVQADGKIITVEILKNHISKTLDAKFSYASALSDVAFFEERLKIHPFLKPYCTRGIPDIRVITYNKIPIMAELRLPTPESVGRANLHVGGIGIGIDMSTGITTSKGVWHNKLIENLPGKKKLPLAGIQIPFWKEILSLSIETQKAIKINYLGSDIAIDRDRGPVIVETNTRPGLAIQIANLSPLKPRLEKVQDIKIKSTKHAVRLARNLFGGEIEEGIEEISGKKIIGLTQPVEVIDKKNQKYSLVAKVDTGEVSTHIKDGLVKKLKLKKTKEEKVPLRLLINETKIETEANIVKDEDAKEDLIIGKKDLKRFLIDPSKIYLKSKKLITKK